MCFLSCDWTDNKRGLSSVGGTFLGDIIQSLLVKFGWIFLYKQDICSEESRKNHIRLQVKMLVAPNFSKSRIHYNVGTAVAQWLRYCATNQKVAGSIPDGVMEVFIEIILLITLLPWGRLSH
jgi:hypothetical protein